MNNETAVGVIVARFQVAELTEGHKEILEYVLNKGHNQNIIFLGVAPTKSTKNNPLDYDSRRRMIEEAYPGKFIVTYHNDEPCDIKWSENLDKKIAEIAGSRDVVLYGSRDSFGLHYFGRYAFEEYHQRVYCSGTEQREIAGKQVQSSRDWRAGCVYATQNKYPAVYPTVDVAIFEEEGDVKYKYIYLAKKHGDEGFRFVGGFTDPADFSFVTAAKREVLEETGIEAELIYWIGSARIDDWRYRGEEDKIITNFFAFSKVGGSPAASDDIAELHKKEFVSVTRDMIVKEHRPLYDMLWDWIKIQKEK